MLERPFCLLMKPSSSRATTLATLNQLPPIKYVPVLCSGLVPSGLSPFLQPHSTTTCPQTGDVNTGFSNSDVVFDGIVRVGGQYHFTLETQSVVAVPYEGATPMLRLQAVLVAYFPLSLSLVFFCFSLSSFRT